MYSLVCKRCGRKLKSETSRRRGYGPACYRKIGLDEKRDTEEPKETKHTEEIGQVKQLDGQLDIEDVLYEMS
ncbi:MAG: hypothetical protein KZY61_00795 [Clostridiaceae bacterium]|nr:hypothetical protein [Clostridiaceae bacterium]MBW4860361.1 hypothetical protein [Clostridiaceae bacterium]MBW4867192.1 hypothetical protein [Clostridiaceae bacterium]